MAEQQQAESGPDHAQLVQILGEIAERSRRLVEDFVERQQAGADPGPFGRASLDRHGVGGNFLDLLQRWMTRPGEVMQAQFDLWQGYMQLWQGAAQRLLGQEVDPVIVPERGDRRFKDPAWDENPLFDFIKQSYLLSSRFLLQSVSERDSIPDQQQQRIEFYVRQFVDALAPSNFALTNPEVLRATLESRGQNLLRGLKNMLEDLERGRGLLAIHTSDDRAFEIGRNIATTQGKVVFQTELMQLIQYAPATPEAHRTPLLIVPPWINRFYVLDLQPENSLIGYAVRQGFTVFVVSWVNPDERLAHKSFEDYMREGPLAALDAIRKATGERQANVVGYCLGGTLMAATAAWLAARRQHRIRALTLFTTLTDFSDPGELGVFIDEEQLANLEDLMARRGYLDGTAMGATFNMLRANDLIWSFVISNYLLGRDLFPFDLLFWNSDNTRMPAAMHGFYLRKCYHENQLAQPGGVTLAGVPIDLHKVRLPVYWLSAREDHIAPWRSTYATTQLFRGERRFVLAGSGHIAGVVNPPAAGKHGYWTNDALPSTPEAWLDGAERHDGSWWEDWAGWLGRHAGELVPARQPGDRELAVIEDAPGSYVRG